MVGALAIRRKTPGEFPQAIVDLLQTFASQSVLAIQNARLFQQVQATGRELDSVFAEAVGQPTVALALAKLPDAHWAALSPAAPLRHWRLIDVQESNEHPRVGSPVAVLVGP